MMYDPGLWKDRLERTTSAPDDWLMFPEKPERYVGVPYLPPATVAGSRGAILGNAAVGYVAGFTVGERYTIQMPAPDADMVALPNIAPQQGAVIRIDPT